MSQVSDKGESREQMKREIMSEIRRDERHRRTWGCLRWMLVKLGLFLVTLLIVAVGIAKTGLYEIPVLTNWLYQAGEPTRVVQPLMGYDDEQVMQGAMARAEYNGSTGLFSVNLTEKELSTLATGAVGVKDDNFDFTIKSAQMAVMEQGIEVFTVLSRPERDVTVKILVDPLVKDGKIVLDAKELQVGSLNMPSFLVSSVSKLISGQFMDSLATGLGELQDVQTKEGELTIIFKPQIKLFQ